MLASSVSGLTLDSACLLVGHDGLQGLSEPLGALMALLSIRPFLTPMRLQYMLAFVGGVMVSFVLTQGV